MKRIYIAYSALLTTLSLLWLVAEIPLPGQFFPLRSALLNLTGILSMGAMSGAMLLAIRPAGLEPHLGGLDKSYRLHKWLGVTSLVTAVVHWLLAVVPKWLVGWGLLVKPARRAVEQPTAVLQLLRNLRRPAESLGEGAFYVAAVLIVLALIPRFPYRWFFKTHRILAIAYLPLAFHSLVLMKPGYWASPIGPVMAVLLVVGAVAAFVSLFRRIGARRRAMGTIEDLELQRDNRVLGVGIRLDGPWSGHEAGQFAFVTFDRAEGPHPFTITSAWQGDGKLRFYIKQLGDYTRTLPDVLKVGDPVQLEGPYGCFDFAGRRPRQIWVAGGIGITPFIARLQELARSPDDHGPIDLFYSTLAPDQTYLSRIRALADEARVRLHVTVTERDGLLDADRLCQTVPEWKEAEVWFCGPVPFGKTLRRDLIARGLSPDDFHQELFAMR